MGAAERNEHSTYASGPAGRRRSSAIRRATRRAGGPPPGEQDRVDPSVELGLGAGVRAVSRPRYCAPVRSAFRLRPPELPAGSIERPRLAGRLAQRWCRRLVTVVAGPGFGKTSLVVGDLTAGSRQRDVWLACHADDAAASSILDGIGRGLGLTSPADVGDVVEAVWFAAPCQICFVLDDVHEIEPRSPGAAVIRQLVADLPRNGHLLLTSRSPVPVPVARLAGQRQLERIVEGDLMFDDDELAAFAAARGVDVAVLRSSGGWPALAELTAAAAHDLVEEFVWDEVLGALGPDRTRDLARLAVAGGADDAIATAVSPAARDAQALVAGVPLVERGADGWVGLHPLWSPMLRRVLTPEEADEARRAAATVHRDAGRHAPAIELFAAASAWDEVLATMRCAELDPTERMSGRRFGAWAATLPADLRRDPVAEFAVAIDDATRLPGDAALALARAADGFRRRGDVDAELAVLHEQGFEMWWANDIAGLAGVIGRVTELAALGHPAAQLLARIGDAGVAHLQGDSGRVLLALDGIDADAAGVWASGIVWLRHVAYRRSGDLDHAEAELDAAHTAGGGVHDVQLRLARLRTNWLRGRVDEVPDDLRSIADHYRHEQHRYLQAESSLELAAKLAWTGRREAAIELLDGVASGIDHMPGALVRVLRSITSVALAVDAGDEDAARDLLVADPVADPGRDDRWYWCDRAAVALPYVLLADQRDGWADAARSEAHRPGVELGGALAAHRAGDSAPLRSMSWPAPGIARAHLPLAWLEELVIAAHAAGNPAPPALLDELAVARGRADAAPRAAATAAGAPHHIVLGGPVPVLSVQVLGPLMVRCGADEIDHPDLRRRRVRELLIVLVAQRRVRREVLAELLWPDVLTGRHNLRVTLNYLRRALGPVPGRGGETAYLRADQETVRVVEAHVCCDLWELAGHLDRADRAERDGDPAVAIDCYEAALPLWTGPPFADVADADWARDEQTRWRHRFGAAAIRCGELHLANGSVDAARRAAERALAADPLDERGYHLLARAHLAAGDPAGARRALVACSDALGDLGLTLDPASAQMLVDLTHRPLTRR